MWEGTDPCTSSCCADSSNPTRKRTKDINTALRRGDTELAIRLAHTVKSISASLGLADFSSISAEVEKELKAGALDDTMGAPLPPACMRACAPWKNT